MGTLLACLRAEAADDPPGTIKLLSNSSFLIDQANNDAYVLSTPERPAWFMFVGPMKVQVDLRVNVPKKGKLKPVTLDVVANGKSVSKLRIGTSPGKSRWKKVPPSQYRPSQPAEFFIELSSGTSEIEFRVEDASKLGTALLVVDANDASRPLAAGAPTLHVTAPAPSKPPEEAPASAPEPEEPKPRVALRGEEPLPPLPDPPPPLPKRRMLDIELVGGAAMQEEPGAFTPAGAGDIGAGVATHLSHQLTLQARYDGRLASISVPLAGEPSPLRTPELRHAGVVGFGVEPRLWGNGHWSLRAHVLGQYRLAAHSNEVASALWGAAGGEVGLALTRSIVTFTLLGGYGHALHDTTPLALTTGRIVGRAFWQLGIQTELLAALSLFAAYRGDVMLRTISWRQSHGVVLGVVLSVL